MKPQLARNILDIWYTPFDSSACYVGRTRTPYRVAVDPSGSPGRPPLDQAITRCCYFYYTELHEMVVRLQNEMIAVILVSITVDTAIRSRNPSSLFVFLCIRSATKGSALHARFGLSAPATQRLEELTLARPVPDGDSVRFSHC